MLLLFQFNYNMRLENAQCNAFHFDMKFIYLFNNKTFSQKKRNDYTQCAHTIIAIVNQNYDGINNRLEKKKINETKPRWRKC